MPQNGVLCGNTAGQQCLGTTAQENGGDDPMGGGASLTTLSSVLDGDQPHVFANCMPLLCCEASRRRWWSCR